MANNPVAVAVGDFNGDGKQDIAATGNNLVPGSPGTIALLFGNEDGTFGFPTSVSVPNQPVALVVGDFNGDGRTDIAVAGVGPNRGDVWVCLGNDDGTFQGPIDIHLLGQPTALTLGDFNHDGKLDLAVSVGTPGKRSASAFRRRRWNLLIEGNS